MVIRIAGDRSGDGGAGRADTRRGGLNARGNEPERIGKEAIVIGMSVVVIVRPVVVVLHSQILRLRLKLPATGELPGEWSPPTSRSEKA